MIFVRKPCVFAIVTAAAIMTGCSAHSAGSFVPLQSGSGSMSSIVMRAFPDAAPPACKGQKLTKNYSTVTEKLVKRGGSLCIPAFGGFGGTVRYPAVNPPVDMTLTSSTSNYAKLPELGKGKALFYLQLALSGSTTFGANLPAGGGLTGKKIVAKKSYTAFGAALVFGFYVQFTPCYVVATPGKYGGVIGGLGTLLKGQTVPQTSGFIEIYPGKQATGAC